MAGSESYSNSDAQTLIAFNKGTEVEVSSDEDGFRGAWYQATILESPPRAFSKKRKKVIVVYNTLLTEDGSAPLTESLDPAFIRPLPPDDPKTGKRDRVFEENDVVDARCRDGWWTGTVRKVLGGNRYRVFFENPPDLIDFDAKDLRVHWDWIFGKWVRPEKQQSTGSVFSSGTPVEVILDMENLRDVWFPAFVIKENGDNTFLVKYQKLQNSNETGSGKVIVDSFHIRPVPPRYADRDYELLERIDAQYDFGWRAGVITKVLAERRYNVFFKHGNKDKELNHSEIRPHVEWVDGKWVSKSKEIMVVSDDEQLGNAQNDSHSPEVAAQLWDKTEEKTSCCTSLIVVEQSNYNKCLPSYALPTSRKKIKLIIANGEGMDAHPYKKSTESDASENPLALAVWGCGKMPIEASTEEPLHSLVTLKTGGRNPRYTKKTVVEDQPSAKTENLSAGKTIQRKAVGLDRQKVDIVTRKGRATKSPFGSPPASAAVKENDGADAADEDVNGSEEKTKEAEAPLILGLEAKAMRSSRRAKRNTEKLSNILSIKPGTYKSMEHSLQKNGGSTGERRRRGRPRKSVIISPKSPAGKDHGAGDDANEMVPKDFTVNEVKLLTQVESTDASGEIHEVGCRTNEIGMAGAGVSKDVVDDDQPLSMWLGGIHFSTSVEELRSSSGKAANECNETRKTPDVAMVSSATDLRQNSVPKRNNSLPFAKRSPLWETIESMEVFQVIPQNPHFHPLAECKEEYREGSAIGITVTFASLFEKISSLHFNDSRNTFESTLESLLDLEKHGFDIAVPWRRVNELLSMKDGQGELLNELKYADGQLKEHIDEERKLKGKMNDIEKKINELREEFIAAKSKMEVRSLESGRLQSHIDAMKERLKTVQNTFAKTATAPWKIL